MGVDGQGDICVSVSEAVGDFNGAAVGVDEHTGVTVAEIVEADVRDACTVGDCVQAKAERLGGHGGDAGGVVGVGEAFVVGEHGGEECGNGDGAVACGGLGGVDQVFAVESVEGFVDTDGTAGKADVLPCEGEHFAAPHTCPEEEVEGDEVVRVFEQQGEAAEVGKCPDVYIVFVGGRQSLGERGGVAGQSVIFDGVAEDGAEEAAHGECVGLGEVFFYKGGLPVIDGKACDFADGHVAEEGNQVFINHDDHGFVGLGLDAGFCVGKVGIGEGGEGECGDGGAVLEEIAFEGLGLAFGGKAFFLFAAAFACPVFVVEGTVPFAGGHFVGRHGYHLVSSVARRVAARRAAFLLLVVFCCQSLLLGALDLQDTLVGRWQVLGHSAAKLGDGLPNLLPYAVMRGVGVLFALHFIAAQLLLGLRCAEEVRGEFGTPHVVENLLALLQALPLVDVLCAQAAVKPFISRVLKYGVIHAAYHSRVAGGSGKGFVVLAHFMTDGKPLLIFTQGIVILHKLLLSGLDREIGLSESNGTLSRIAVHRDEITRIARKVEVFYLAFCTTAKSDHIVHLHEMV